MNLTPDSSTDTNPDTKPNPRFYYGIDEDDNSPQLALTGVFKSGPNPSLKFGDCWCFKGMIPVTLPVTLVPYQ